MDGANGLHFLSDFDGTLTYGTIDGVKTPSIISMLRDGKHLTEDYAAKAHALFDHYHPIELDLSISINEKKTAMRQWWDKHDRLLIESGLSKNDLADIVANGHLKFRDGAMEFLTLLNEKNIPLIIMSASGCGDAIPIFFEKNKLNFPNIY